MKLSKLASLLLAGALILTLASCNSGNVNPGSSSGSSGTVNPGSSSSSSETEHATLSILLGGTTIPPTPNPVLTEIEKRTNTTLNVTYVTSGDYVTKLNALIASKTLPDMFKAPTVSDAQNYKNNGMLAELTTVLPDNSKNLYPEVKSLLDKNPLNTDGKIYALFGASVSYDANVNIRTDWLQNLGLQMPTDLDSLYNVLDAFTNKDPDGDGQKDTFGLVASIAQGWVNFQNIFGAYGIPAGFQIQLSDDTVTTFMKSPNYTKVIEYYQKLYQNGLMDPDFATIQPLDSLGKLWNGQGGVFEFQCIGPTNNWYPSRYTEKVTPTFGFATIKGPDGKCGVPELYPSYTTCFVVASTCKNVAAAVRLYDYFYSSAGDELLCLGIEGKHFNWTDKSAGTYTKIPPYDDTTTNRNDGVFLYWGLISPIPKNNTQMLTLNALTKQGVALYQKNATIPWANILTAFNADTQYGSNLRDIEKQAFCSLVTSKGDLTSEYSDWISKWNSAGGTEWEKEATAAYKAQPK